MDVILVASWTASGWRDRVAMAAMLASNSIIVDQVNLLLVSDAHVAPCVLRLTGYDGNIAGV